MQSMVLNLKKMRLCLGSISCLALLMGCAGTGYTQTRDIIPGAKGHKIALAMITPEKQAGDLEKLIEKLNLDSEIANCTDVTESAIGSAPDAVAPALLPILTTVGKFVFDQHQDRKLRNNSQLKKAAQRSFSGRAILSSGELKRTRCAVLMRYQGTVDNPKLGMVAILQLKHHIGELGAGFVFQPIYVAAADSVAITRADKKTKKVGLGVSGAISIAAIGQDRATRLPVLKEIGISTSTVSKVLIGEGNACAKSCPPSGLIPHMLENNEIVSIAVAITETGKVGIDFEAREAEIKAVKEAFGPAIKDSLTELLSKDD